MMNLFIHSMLHNKFVIIVAAWIVFDTITGCLRAFKQHTFNSSFGIDGGIRKCGMLVSVVFLMFFDILIGINMINILPDEILAAIGNVKIGTGEFFCILYFLYESLSIMKNCYLCGLPLPKWLQKHMEKLLKEMTGELQKKAKIAEETPR